MMRAWALALVGLILLSGCLGTIQRCTGAGAPPGPGGCCPGTYLTETGTCETRVNWYGPTMIALLLSSFVVAVMFMLAFGFGMPSLLVWAKNELYQLVATAIFVGAMFVIISFIDQVFVPLFYLPWYLERVSAGLTVSANDAFQVAEQFLAIAQRIVIVFYIIFNGMNIAFGVLASSTVSIAPMRVGITIQPGVALRPILDALAIVLNGQGLALASIIGQQVFLKFVRDTMMPIFLPVGILLRTFPFTRSAGGALIAIAVGFYVVWPLTYIMSFEFLKAHMARAYCFGAPLPPSCTALYVAERITEPMREHLVNAVSTLLNPSGFVYLGEVFFLLFLLPTGKLIPALTVILIMLIGYFVYMTVVLGFVMPALQLLITFTAIRGLANILGADVNLQALSKIV